MSWDNVDPEFLKAPRRWSADGISRFMLWLGPTSSVFDIATYLLLYFVICPQFTGGVLSADNLTVTISFYPLHANTTYTASGDTWDLIKK